MRVFLAGATGAIGRPLLAKLLSEGHDVIALTRSADHAKAIVAPGVQVIVCDVYDRDALVRAAVRTKPDVVMHQLTALPRRIRPHRVLDDVGATNRLRIEGTKNLLEAARASGSTRFIAQSIAFVTKPVGPSILDESAPLYLDAAPGMRPLIAAVDELERMVTSEHGIEGVALRYGFFYGPGTSYGEGGAVLEDIDRRRVPIVGSGAGMWSFIHVNDAADATLAAMQRGKGVYNITDDDPAPAREWIATLGARRGKKPFHVPAFVARFAAGPYGMFLMTELRGASNAKAKRELEWSPAHPSWKGTLGD